LTVAVVVGVMRSRWPDRVAALVDARIDLVEHDAAGACDLHACAAARAAVHREQQFSAGVGWLTGCTSKPLMRGAAAAGPAVCARASIATGTVRRPALAASSIAAIHRFIVASIACDRPQGVAARRVGDPTNTPGPKRATTSDLVLRQANPGNWRQTAADRGSRRPDHAKSARPARANRAANLHGWPFRSPRIGTCLPPPWSSC
jgi:hypothetical protein